MNHDGLENHIMSNLQKLSEIWKIKMSSPNHSKQRDSNVNIMVDRFLDPNTDLPPANPIRNPNNKYLTQVESQIQVEKKRKEELNKERKALEKEK